MCPVLITLRYHGNGTYLVVLFWFASAAYHAGSFGHAMVRPDASGMAPKSSRKVRLGRNAMSLIREIFWKRKSRNR